MAKLLCGLVAGAALLAGAQASAATITRTYTFTMSDFTPLAAGPPAPVDPLTGSFTVTFDPTVAVSDVTSGLTVHSFNLPIGGVFAFSYTPFGELSLGAIVGPSDEVGATTWGTDDVDLSFFHPLTSPIAPSAFYTRAGVSEAWSADAGTVSAYDGSPGVPEPATWALMMLGLGGLGSALRRRHLVRFAAG